MNRGGGDSTPPHFAAILASVFTTSSTMLAITFMYHAGWRLTCEWMHAMYAQPPYSQRMCVVRLRLDLCAHRKAVALALWSAALSNLKGVAKMLREGGNGTVCCFGENPATMSRNVRSLEDSSARSLLCLSINQVANTELCSSKIQWPNTHWLPLKIVLCSSDMDALQGRTHPPYPSPHPPPTPCLILDRHGGCGPRSLE